MLIRCRTLAHLLIGAIVSLASYAALGAQAVTSPGSTNTNGRIPATSPLPRGQVVDPVACAVDPEESYALYIPSSYTPERPSPIIYIFDPEARGEIAVQLYKGAAEKYGYILAASNNSRNFQNGAVSRAIKALWDDTHTRLNLDPRRIYTMGFSGGARVATTIAVRCEFCAIAGVISHGAGYPFDPSDKDRFAYFAFIGDRDFNWPEIMELRQKKEDWPAPYRLHVFSGEHQWAPPAIFVEALEWFQLRAMLAGTVAPDPTFIDQEFLKIQKQAEDARAHNDPITEFDAYRSLTLDFSGLKDVASFQAKLAALKNSPEFKRALKKQQEAIDQQRALTRDLSSDLNEIADAALDVQMSLRVSIVDGMAGLKKKADHARSDQERLIYTRAFDDLWVQAIEAGQGELETTHHYAKAELYFRLMASITPDQPWPALLLAETAAARGDKKAAYKELRDAIKRGLKNPETLAKEANLQSLATDAEFQQIVADLRSKQTQPPPAPNQN